MDENMGNVKCVDQKELVEHVDTDGTIYHEKQSRELCALHALNNLCQNRTFTKRDLDNICYTLSPEAYVNPHKSMFGLGNYDVNVIMAALQTKDLDTVWFDKRKDINGLVLDNIRGLILNIPMDYKWGILHLPLRRKHWIVIRRVGRGYYNLDSKLELPELIGTLADVKHYLREQMACKEKELLLVVDQNVSGSGSWWQQPNAADKNAEEIELPMTADDDKSQDVELTIDCHIVCNDVDMVVKPKHLKKYHQDYVPIEIHRTFHKKSEQEANGLLNEQSEEMVPVDTDSRVGSGNGVVEVRDEQGRGVNIGEEAKRRESGAVDGNTPVTVVRQAASAAS